MALNIFENVETGDVAVQGKGLFTPDVGQAELGYTRRVLALHPTPVNRNRRVPSRVFSDSTPTFLFYVDPNEKHCLIGRNKWNEIHENGLFKEDYDSALRTSKGKIKHEKVARTLYMKRINLSPLLLNSKPVTENWNVTVGISNDLHDDLLLLGNVILKYGVLFWTPKFTSFVWNTDPGIDVAGNKFLTHNPPPKWNG